MRDLSMKYLILDTNIYLDMIVSRTKGHKSDSYDHMQKLLDYDEIKLIVPAVVVTETKRHLGSEIKKVKTHLQKINSNIKNLYWINKIEELETFNNNIKAMKEVASNLLQSFKVEEYISDAHSLFDRLFGHDNVLILEETSNILAQSNRRRLHKKRPYHYNEKEKDSFADAVIIETLLNLEDYKELIDLKEDDKLYFVSQNTKDFSDEVDNNSLHPDILESLKLKALDDQFNYRIHFTKTLLEDFREEIESAGLREELEDLWEEELIEEFRKEEIARNRESGGLRSLSADWYEIVSEKPEIYDLLSYFTEVKEELERHYASYSEDFYEVLEFLNSMTPEDLRDKCLDKFWEVISLDPDDYTIEELWKCDDYFHWNGDILEFKDFDNKLFNISVEGKLNPQNGEIDTILVKANNSRTKESIFGEIEVTYGYLNFDENEQAADGLQDRIDFSLGSICEAVENEQNFILGQIEDAKEILDNFRIDYRLN